MFVLKKVILVLGIMITVIFAVGLMGCAPKGDPSQVLNDYYDNIKSGDAEAAYNTLADASKKNFKKDDFVKWVDVQSQIGKLKGTKITKLNEYKNKKLDNIDYKNAVEFNIVQNTHDNYENKDVTDKYKTYVVNDSGNWKVYRGKENVKETLSKSMNYLAWMYIDGKGKDKDLNQAASILNESVKANPSYNPTYYALAYVYFDLERYDESISAANKYLSKAKDEKEKSDAYNILGLDYKGKEDYTNAKKYFNQAIQLNPNNQYAKTNLQQLGQEEELDNLFKE